MRESGEIKIIDMQSTVKCFYVFPSSSSPVEIGNVFPPTMLMKRNNHGRCNALKFMKKFWGFYNSLDCNLAAFREIFQHKVLT